MQFEQTSCKKKAVLHSVPVIRNQDREPKHRKQPVKSLHISWKLDPSLMIEKNYQNNTFQPPRTLCRTRKQIEKVRSQIANLSRSQLWISIRSFGHHIGDLDPYPFKPNVQTNYIYFFPRKFQNTVQNIVNLDAYDSEDKNVKVTYFSDFSTYVKLWLGSGSGSGWRGNVVWSGPGSASRGRRSTILLKTRFYLCRLGFPRN